MGSDTQDIDDLLRYRHFIAGGITGREYTGKFRLSNPFVVPVVQSFMQQQDRIAEEVRKQIHSSCCEFVLAHACRAHDLTFPKNSKVLAAEETNIQSIFFSSPTSHTVPSDRTMEALIAFGWHRCDTKPNLEIANNVLAAAKNSGVQRYMASAVWCLGQTYNRLGDYPTSYNHLQEAYQLFNTLPPGEIALQRLSGQCALGLVNAARMTLPVERLGEVVSLARDVEKKCAVLSDDVTHGRSLAQLAAVLHKARQPQEALRYLDQARTMLKAAGNISNLATVCRIISQVHYDEGRLQEALDAIEEAWKYAELTDSPSTQAYASLDFGVVLFSANKDTKAWKQIEIALMKASYVGDRLYIARALEYMGYGYLRRGDYQNAYGAYDAAAERYLSTDHADISGGRCKNNMARIEQKQGNPDAVVGFYRPDFDIDETLFYPPVQVSTSELPISSS